MALDSTYNSWRAGWCEGDSAHLLHRPIEHSAMIELRTAIFYHTIIERVYYRFRAVPIISSLDSRSRPTSRLPSFAAHAFIVQASWLIMLSCDSMGCLLVVRRPERDRLEYRKNRSNRATDPDIANKIDILIQTRYCS